MTLSTQPYKGTRDFYPEDMRLRTYIFDIWKSVSEKYGYQAYDTPILEPTDLYKAKSGAEIVDEQSYRFNDRGGRDMMIRPEMTPSVSRLVAGKRQELGYPVRWYSIADFMRYERPQRGRLRQFTQLNVDIFGVKTIDAELELIQIADEVMQKLGADRNMYQIKINSRRLVALIMVDYLQLDASKTTQMSKLLDKKDKMPEETFYSNAKSIFETDVEERTAKLRTLLNAGSMAGMPEMIKQSDAVKEIQILFTLLAEHGISNAQFDVSLMRGLDYYTDIVFEVFDLHEDNNRSIFGGGRYDGLVGMFGAEPVATAGFAIGDVPLTNFIKSHKLLPNLRPSTDIVVIPVGGVLRQAQGVAGLLRSSGLNVAVDITDRKTAKQIKSVEKQGVRFVLFVGEDELNSEKFNLKDIESGESSTISVSEVVTAVRERQENL